MARIILPALTLGLLDSRYVNITGDTMTGALTVSPSITVPLLIGGTGTTSDLTLQTTSGIGATGADMHFLVGNNGATEAITILNSGNVGIGTTAPSWKLDVVGNARVGDSTGWAALYLNGATANWRDFVFTTAGSNRWSISVDATAESGSNIGSDFQIKRKGDDGVSIDTPFFIKRSTGNIAINATDPGTAKLYINGNVGIGTTSPTYLLSLGGNSARIFWMERHTTANTAGNSLTVEAGGATSGATDKTGGNLILKSGLATGTGSSDIVLQTHPAGTTGTTDTTATETFRVKGNGSVVVPVTITAVGTTGNQTINKAAGRVNIAAAGTTVTVTNSLVTANSIVLAVAATADATARVTNVVPATGSFVINTVAVTAETAFNFLVIS